MNEKNTSEKLFLFVDTNCLLHYRPISEIDWIGLTGKEEVILVFCLQVISELDEKKDHPSLGGRAKNRIKEINRFRRPGQVLRDSVTVEIFNQPIRLEDFPSSLSPDSKDDKIVHSVILFMQGKPGGAVAVYTEDLGMELRCEAHDICTLKPDQALRLESPQPKQQKENQRLQQELSSLRNRSPKLQVRISESGTQPVDTPYRVVLAYGASKCSVDEEMSKLKASYPKVRPKQSYTSRVPLISFSALSDERLENYFGKLDGFYIAYEQYLIRLNTWRENSQRTFCFDLWVKNAGTEPATDIDLYLTFPSRICWLAKTGSEEEKLLLEPTKPSPPELPQSGWPVGTGQQISELSAIHRAMLPSYDFRDVINPSRDLSETQISDSEDQMIHVYIGKLKHGQANQLGTFSAVFQNWNDVKPFNAKGIFSCSEIGSATEHEIPFIVEKRKDE